MSRFFQIGSTRSCLFFVLMTSILLNSLVLPGWAIETSVTTLVAAVASPTAMDGPPVTPVQPGPAELTPLPAQPPIEQTVPVAIPPDLPLNSPSPAQPFFWQPSQRVEQQTVDAKGQPSRQVTTTFTPRSDDTSKQIPFLAIGALNQQTLFYINPTPSGQGKEDDPDWFQRTLLYQSMRAMQQAQGFNANHFDYVKVRLVYDARFEDRKGRPKHYLMQRDIKLNFEDIRWYATPRRVPILSNAELERKLAHSSHYPFPSWLGRQMLIYQPTQRVKAIVLFAPGQSQSTLLTLLQGILGLGAQFGAINAGVRAGG